MTGAHLVMLCIPVRDDVSLAEGEYVDLSLVPERYTGYSGPSAHRVWKSIYEENCFGLSELNLLTARSPSQVTLPDTLTDVLREPIDGEDAGGECLEKRVYYKIISGLHASISTHICNEYLNQTTGEMVRSPSRFPLLGINPI